MKALILTAALSTSHLLLLANAAPNAAKPFDPKLHTDWGTYYDPKSIFCGNFDCYKILGFDFEDYGSPETKEITKRYRSLSRLWHPDKNKHRDAKDRFVKIARAYEVLTDTEVRKEYDFMRYNQEAYYQKYGSSVLYDYAPKSDTLVVLFFLLAIGSAISWFFQRQHWQNVADKLIKAAVEDWSLREGGTPESKDLRTRALVILNEQEAKEEATSEDKKAKKKAVKLTATEKRKEQQEALRPIIVELVEAIHDFGAGYHKPTWRDLLVVKMAYMPVSLAAGLWWNIKYGINRLSGKELTEGEREVLTRRAIGEVNWFSASEEDRTKFLAMDLWKPANMVEWEEQRELSMMSAGDQKRYKRMQKKGFKDDKDE